MDTSFLHVYTRIFHILIVVVTDFFLDMFDHSIY
jgi:hypothetical protein